MIDPMILPIAALAIPLVIAPAKMAFSHAAKLRDLEHAEKMRALELGRFNPADGEWTTHARIGAGVGVAVPIVAMIAAMMATLEVGFHQEIWMFSGMVGTAAVISGACLAAKARPDFTGETAAKPVYEPDAFDVVGTRG